MGDVVTTGGWVRVEELEMIMGAEIDEALGQPKLDGTSPQSENMDCQSSGGTFALS